MDTPHISASVWVTTDFVGFHEWPDAPMAVGYLRQRHRHLFKVRVELTVKHDDREIEFHLFKEALGDFIAVRNKGFQGWDDKPASSCEAIARDIFRWADESYPNRPYLSVSVSEDGENGATIEG